MLEASFLWLLCFHIVGARLDYHILVMVHPQSLLAEYLGLVTGLRFHLIVSLNFLTVLSCAFPLLTLHARLVLSLNSLARHAAPAAARVGASTICSTYQFMFLISVVYS
jgi:hypothetical protein